MASGPVTPSYKCQNFLKQRNKHKRHYISPGHERWPAEASSVITSYLNEEHQAKTLPRVCPSLST